MHCKKIMKKTLQENVLEQDRKRRKEDRNTKQNREEIYGSRKKVGRIRWNTEQS